MIPESVAHIADFLLLGWPGPKISFRPPLSPGPVPIAHHAAGVSVAHGVGNRFRYRTAYLRPLFAAFPRINHRLPGSAAYTPFRTTSISYPIISSFRCRKRGEGWRISGRSRIPGHDSSTRMHGSDFLRILHGPARGCIGRSGTIPEHARYRTGRCLPKGRAACGEREVVAVDYGESIVKNGLIDGTDIVFHLQVSA